MTAWDKLAMRQELDTADAESVILPLVDEGQEDIIVILDEYFGQPAHYLTRSRALTYAQRLIDLVRQAEYHRESGTERPRALRRPVHVDDQLRAIDD